MLCINSVISIYQSV